MSKKYKCVFIIPYHKDKFDDKLYAAVKSYNEALNEYNKHCGDDSDNDDFDLVIISKKDFTSNLKEFNCHVVTEDFENTSYQHLVNYGINMFKDDAMYISIMGYSDILTKNALKIFREYVLENTEDVGIHTGLSFVAERTDDEKPVLVNIINEASMAQGVSEEYGYVDFNMMLRSNFIFINGLFIKSNVFDEIGQFKENFELFYDYEWSLRAVYNGIVIKAIPKATHIHFMNSDDPDNIKNKIESMPKNIIDQWVSLARREYFFNEERELPKIV